MVWSVKKFKSYVWGKKINVVTDHHYVCCLMKKRDLVGRWARWSLQLQDLDIKIVCRSGRRHSDADPALSRSPVDPPEEKPEILTMILFTLQQLTKIHPLKGSKLGLEKPTLNLAYATRKLIRDFEIRKWGTVPLDHQKRVSVLQTVCSSFTNEANTACLS